MKPIHALLLTLALLFAGTAAAQAGECEEVFTVRPGMQATGTFSWVVHAMDYFGTAEEYCLELEPTTYASKQAAELALRAGEADVVVDDIIGAVTLRNNGIPVKAVYPYSKATGGVVVPVDSEITSIPDLEGKTIAASSLDDKSLLILRALTTSEYGFDPQEDGETLQAAPWLMAGLLESGEIDAGIPYWHFVARMTATGEFRDLMMVTEMLDQLGMRSDLPILVVVARDGVEDEAVRRFIEALIATTDRMQNDDGIWQSILDNELYSLPDPSLFPEVRKRWEAGLPEEWNQEMIDQLVELVDRLVEVAGPEVVGVERIDPEAFTTEFAPEG
ncbi:MAG TPA: ABC transporter substrate-binding protein [Trueperaceae bacterium]